MDSIIGLLFVLVPIAFSLIGKKLEKAGDSADAAESADVPPPVQEAFPTIKPFMVDDEQVPPPPVAQEVAGTLPPKPPKSVLKPRVTKVVEESRKKEPIDPKKLVIYSEIMKPKYLE